MFQLHRLGHRAAECRSKSCQYCDSKHHLPVSDKKSGGVLLATGEVGVVYPAVIVKVEGVSDTGSGSTYVSISVNKDKLIG